MNQQSQQTDNMNSQMSRSLSGVKSILKRYNSSSQILIFQNQFHRLIKRYDNKGIFGEKVYYYGNSSDLWAFLAKYIAALKLQANLLAEKQIQFGQAFMLFCAKEHVQNLWIRLQLQELYFKKNCSLKQRIHCQRYGKNQSQYEKNCQKPRQEWLSQQSQKINLHLMTSLPVAGKNQSIVQDLLKFLSILRERSKQRIQQKLGFIKPILIIMIVSKLLTFVLSYMELERVKQLSIWKQNLEENKFFVNTLTQYNGAMKIALYLKDADAIKVLWPLAQKMQKILLTK